MSKRSKKGKAKASSSPAWMVKGCVGKGNKENYLSWRNRGFFSSGTPSECKRIDPLTGEVVVANILEAVADDILKTDKKVSRHQGRTPRRRKTAARTSTHTPSVSEKTEFYKSWEWRKLRMQVLKLQGRSCQCCGASPGEKDMSSKAVKITVDHIKPISKFWGLRLKRDNLQVLCDECNQGKGNWDETDFRAADAWIVEPAGVDPAVIAQLSYQGETIQ